MSRTTGHEIIVDASQGLDYVDALRPNKLIRYLNHFEQSQRMAREAPLYFEIGSSTGTPTFGARNVRYNIPRTTPLLKGEYLVFLATISALVSANTTEYRDGYGARLLEQIKLKSNTSDFQTIVPQTHLLYNELQESNMKTVWTTNYRWGLSQATRQAQALAIQTIPIFIPNPFRGNEILRVGNLRDDHSLFFEVDIAPLADIAFDSLGAGVTGTLSSLVLTSTYSYMIPSDVNAILSKRITQVPDIQTISEPVSNGSTSASIRLPIKECEFLMFYLATDTAPFTPLALTTYHLDLDGIQYPSRDIPSAIDSLIQDEYFGRVISANIHSVRMGTDWYMDDLNDTYQVNASLNGSSVRDLRLNLTFSNPGANSHLYIMNWGRAIYEYKQDGTLLKSYKSI